LLHLNYDKTTIQQRILQLQDIPMRLTWKEGIDQCMLIDDTYNNDLAGLKVALAFMEQKHSKSTSFKINRRKTVILSDLLETGLRDEVLYPKIATYLLAAGVDRLVLPF